jgi:phospholipid transport system substrate-binding protein
MAQMKKPLSLLMLMTSLQLTTPAISEAYAAPGASPALQATAPAATPATFAGNIARSVLTIVRDKNMPLATKKAQLEQQFNNTVDVNWIARYVIGQSWNSSSPSQQMQYTTLYRKYLTSTYLASFDEESENNLRDIRILDVADLDKNSVTVQTEMVMADGNNMYIEYVISNQTGHYQVIDIVLEGVSLLKTHHSELSTLANAQGMDGVIGKLQQMVSKSQGNVTLSMKQ